MFNKGDLVETVCGHDAGSLMIVIDIEDGFLVVCDGKTRRAEKRKRKNIKHIKALGLNTDLINNIREEMLESKTRAFVESMSKLSVCDEDIIDLVNKVIEEMK